MVGRRSSPTRGQISRVLEHPEAILPVFQPILSLVSGRVAGYEAFSRFGPDSMHPPNAWFARATRLGLGAELQSVALERILTTAADPVRPSGTFLSVNVSPRYLAHRRVAAALEAAIGADLVIEVTEDEPVDDYETLRRAMKPYRDRGVRFGVDDAGAGFASMRHVTELGPAFIKLDSTLVRGMRVQRTLQAFLRAVNAFASDIGATLVAEGIEETSDLAAVTRTGFPLLAQGYAIARPGQPWPRVKAEALEAWAGSREASSVALATLSVVRSTDRPPTAGRAPIASAVNIGTVLAASLHGIGIDDLDGLRAVGAVAAWKRIRAVEPEIATERAILALEGAVRGIRWTALSPLERERLIGEAG